MPTKDPYTARALARNGKEKDMTTPASTMIQHGELRATLQPVRVLTLLSSHGDHLEAGMQVVAQYWGDGNVRLTPTKYPQFAATVKAADIHGVWLTPQD